MKPDIMFLLGVFVGAALGLIVCTQVYFNTFEKDAIQHNAAHYDAKTGAFTWNDEGKTP